MNLNDRAWLDHLEHVNAEAYAKYADYLESELANVYADLAKGGDDLNRCIQKAKDIIEKGKCAASKALNAR